MNIRFEIIKKKRMTIAILQKKSPLVHHRSINLGDLALTKNYNFHGQAQALKNQKPYLFTNLKIRLTHEHKSRLAKLMIMGNCEQKVTKICFWARKIKTDIYKTTMKLLFV